MEKMLAVAEGLDSLANATLGDHSHLGTQGIEAIWLLDLMSAALPLSDKYNQQLSTDMHIYYADAAKTADPNDPGAAAVAASAYMQYNNDSAEMSKDTEYLNNLIQTGKSADQQAGNLAQKVFGMVDTPYSVFATTNQCMQMLAG